MSRLRVVHLLTLPLALLLAGASHAEAASPFSRASQGPAGSRSAASATALVSRMSLDPAAVEAFRLARGGSLSLPLADGSEVALELEPYDLMGAGNRVTITDEQGRRPAPVSTTLYRGRVVGEQDSWAVIALAEGGAMGTVERAGRRWQLQPEEAGGGPGRMHAFSPEEALTAETAPRLCGIDESNEARYQPFGPGPVADPGRLRTGPGRDAVPGAVELNAPRIVFSVAVDCDQEIYGNKFGSNLTNATNYVLTLLGTVNLIYERDVEITLKFPYVNLWTTSDPYTAGTTSAQLTEFQNYWNANMGSVSRSSAHLLSGRALGGGIAYVGAMCGGFGYAVSAIDANYSYPTSTATWDVNVVAHEQGHNLGAWHTHSCNYAALGYYPAGGTPDSCQASEGGCATYSNHLPPDKGTIMSYCHLIGGVTNGIRLDFHPASIQRMLAYASTAGCLQPSAVAPARNPQIATTATGVRLSWNTLSIPNFVRYDIHRSALPLDLNPVYIGSTTSNLFDDAALGLFHYRIRTRTTTDSSSWSAELKANVCAFTPAVNTTTGVLPSAVRAADLNEDGIQDLVVANYGTSTLSVLLGNGTAGVGDGTFAAPTSCATGTNPGSLAFTDVDDDGILDVVVGLEGQSALAIHHGQGAGGAGDGSLSAPDLITLPMAAKAIAIADLDEDGYEDLIAVGGGSGLAIARGQGTDGIGNGMFEAASLSTVNSLPAAVHVVDLNEDGIWDLAVGASGLRVLIGNGTAGKGDGTFADVVSYAVGSTPSSIASGDLNGDGITDLVVGNAGASSVSVLLGNGSAGVGDGTLQPAITVSTGTSGPRDVQLADWDQDGVPDIGMANNSAAKVATILIGNGDGTFGGPNSYAVSSAPYAFAVSDFDEDGGVDLAVCNRSTQNVSKLLAGCDATQPSDLTLDSPKGGETWGEGDERTISWTKGAGVLSVDVQLSHDSGVNWQTLAADVHDTSFTWSVTPRTAAGTASVRVVDHNRPQYSDSSDALFTIDPMIELAAGSQVQRLTLSGAWPNPMRGSLTVSFALPREGDAQLELLDLAGRRVASRFEPGLSAGAHRVTLARGLALAPGLYLVRLAHGGETRSLKVTVVD